jgi:hypothetical protein
MPEPNDSFSGLLPLVQYNKASSVSFVGMAKNVGKTVSFNHLIRQATAHKLRLGLTSIGRDGERRDEVFHSPKPRIFAPAGALLATARGSLARSEVCFEVLLDTGLPTAIGEVVLVRTRKAGFVELAGPTLISQQKFIQTLFAEYGADLTLIDGALDRVSPAVPGLTQATILATGAAVGASIEIILKKTMDRLQRLALPRMKDIDGNSCRQIIDSCKAAILDEDNQITILPVEHSLLAGKHLLKSITRQTQTVILAGAVGDAILECLLASKTRGAVQLVIKNGAALFCSAALWRRFSAAGGLIRVVEPIQLLAVTVNPASPSGSLFEAQDFFARIAEGLAPYTVVDVVAGLSTFTGGMK